MSKVEESRVTLNLEILEIEQLCVMTGLKV